jgi:hypothetical protein
LAAFIEARTAGELDELNEDDDQGKRAA